MKKTMLLAAVLVMAACTKKTETPAADTSGAAAPAPAPAPAAAPTDTGMAAPHDTGAMHHDTTMARDTTKK